MLFEFNFIAAFKKYKKIIFLKQEPCICIT